MKKGLFLMAATALACLSGCSKQHANVGLLYCSAEANSIYQVNVVKEELEKKGYTAKLISFSDSNDISAVLNGNINDIDSIYIPTDNTCAANTEIINNIARANKKPVYAGEEGICKGCGAITLSINYYNIGFKTGEMAVDVLLGHADIKTMPIAYDQNPVKKYNAAICNELGITVPSDYVEVNSNAAAATPAPIAFQNTSNQSFKIGISQLVQHPALDAATQGFKDAVIQGLGEENVNVTFDVKNASNDIPTCSVIANNFVSHNYDLIMANATPALQAAANATAQNPIPVLGTSVTEYGVALNIPNFSGVVGTNVSGTSDLAPLTEQANMLAEIFKDFLKK